MTVLFSNFPTTTVTSGGTDNPSPGTVETWTVSSSAEFPTASSAASSYFHVSDESATTELIKVTNVSGNTWTVTRGDEGTTTYAHTTGFTITQVVTAGDLAAMFQSTALPLSTLGDTLYENATPTLARLAGNTSATKKFLTQTGTGSVSAAPSWGTISSGDVPTLNQNTTGTASNITDTLDQVPSPAANVAMNSHKFTGMANGSASTDSAAFGQIPVLGVASGSVSWFNVKAYGATGNGSTDDTTSIQNTITAAASGGVVYLPEGNYLINTSSSLNVSNNNISIIGDGPAATTITIGTSFSASEGINITGNNCAVANLQMTATLNGSNKVNAVQITGCQRGRVYNTYFFGINGYCVESISTSSTFNADQMFSQIAGRNCAGGIHIKGYAAGGSHAENFLTDMQFQEMGAASGPATGLDTFLFEDCHDILGENFNVGFAGSASTPGSALHLHGSTGASSFTNMDLGPGTYSLLIDDGSNGSVFEVSFDNYIGGQAVISGGCHRIQFSNSRFTGSTTHGTTVSSTGFGIDFSDCDWYGNGTGASGSNYDLNWSGTATGSVSSYTFEDTPVTIGMSGVQANVLLASNNQRVYFRGNRVQTNPTFVNTPAQTTGGYAPGPNSSDNGFLAANLDIDMLGSWNGTLLTGGTLYLMKIGIWQPTAVNKINWWNTVVGSGPVTGENFAGIYNSSGTLLTSASADSTVNAGSLQNVTLGSTQILLPGYYWVALLFNAIVEPTILRSAVTSLIGNAGLTSSTLRFAVNGTGLTALPSTITTSSNVTTNAVLFWVALS